MIKPRCNYQLKRYAQLMTRNRRPSAAAARRENDMERITDHKKIIDHMKSGKRLDGWTAVTRLKMIDYRARISELRRMGWDIQDEYVKEYDRDGKYKGHHKEYFLGRKQRVAI